MSRGGSTCSQGGCISRCVPDSMGVVASMKTSWSLKLITDTGLIMKGMCLQPSQQTQHAARVINLFPAGNFKIKAAFLLSRLIGLSFSQKCKQLNNFLKLNMLENIILQSVTIIPGLSDLKPIHLLWVVEPEIFHNLRWLQAYFSSKSSSVFT